MENNLEIPKTYSPSGVEDKWYQTWLEQKCFSPVPGKKKKTYSILMPPPNVTGKLHIGHALDHTLQDVLIRYKRMQGFETLWIPGQDHAGIATQAKVEQKIFQEEGKTKHDIGREEFLKRVWDWKEEYGGHILDQIKKIGDSCDWDYNTFTMDSIPNQAVRTFFVQLFNEGLIYQSDYIINWDPTLQSAISDAEVEHKEVQGKFYHLHYRVKDSEEVLEIATTRPETLFGDTAVAVNPNDDRFEHLIGKKAIVPICDREVTIIADTHVDMEVGTGCLKVTPGHDFNDFEIGKRHDLEIINILNPDGTLNEQAKAVEGLSTKEARKKTVKLLEESGLLVKTEDHKHQVGHGQRSGKVVEPMVSKQWFLDTEKMAQLSVKRVEEADMRFFPDGWKNTYFSYQKNPRPWCISRQLWWGHQIPVYTCDSCDHVWASVEAPNECPQCQAQALTQDPDVLDTWFSSGLFPLSTLGWPNKEAMQERGFDRFYPSQTLVTGYDIIFFWVARMMMMSEKAVGKIPFSDVYIHALVRDKNGVKMSKSIGNVIDPLEVISDYGCDAMRFTLAFNSGYNRNINLDPAVIEGNRNFINKLWNAFRFIHPYLAHATDAAIEVEDLHHHEKWILSEFNTLVKTVEAGLDEYRFDEACGAIYQFVYEKFCSWFIELSKGVLNSENSSLKAQRANVFKYLFKKIVALLHPVTPFITEEMWSYLKTEEEKLLIVSEYPEYSDEFHFPQDVELMNKFMEVTTAIRNLRSQINLSPKEEVEVNFFTDDADIARYFYRGRGYFKELAKVSAGKIKDKTIERPKRSIFLATSHTEIYLPLEGVIDLKEQIQRVQKDMDKTRKEFDKLEKKLSNPKFVENAPEEIIAEVKEKANGYNEKLKSLTSMLENLQ